MLEVVKLRYQCQPMDAVQAKSFITPETTPVPCAPAPHGVFLLLRRRVESSGTEFPNTIFLHVDK